MHIWFLGCKTNEEEHGMGFKKGIKEDKREGTGNTKRVEEKEGNEVWMWMRARGQRRRERTGKVG
jgi:hypothetical protein